MKRDDLIALLQVLPEDAEIVVNNPGDDILGQHNYSSELSIEQAQCTENFEATHSNYAIGAKKLIDIYIIQ